MVLSWIWQFSPFSKRENKSTDSLWSTADVDLVVNTAGPFPAGREVHCAWSCHRYQGEWKAWWGIHLIWILIHQFLLFSRLSLHFLLDVKIICYVHIHKTILLTELMLMFVMIQAMHGVQNRFTIKLWLQIFQLLQPVEYTQE